MFVNIYNNGSKCLNRRWEGEKDLSVQLCSQSETFKET